MPQENLISVDFSDQEIRTLKDAVSMIVNTLRGKTISLTPQQRRQYGRVKYEKEIWIDKVKMHMDANPDHIPSYIDKMEFERDYKAHKVLNELITLLEQPLNQLMDTNLLLGYDLDMNSLMFYRSIKVSAQNNAVGAVSIYQDLKQQYPSARKAQKPTEEDKQK